MPTSISPPARRPPVVAEIDARLHGLLHQTVADIAMSSHHAARAAVRRRLARLHRRRRLRHALGSGTLAAGMVASAAPVRHGWVTAPSEASGGPAAAGDPRPADRQAGPAPRPGAVSLSRDPIDGVEREAADPGALYASGRFHVYATSATHCVSGVCHHYWVPRFTGPDLAEPGRLRGDAMPARPDWVAGDDRVIWAPSVVRNGGRYVLYFAATSGRPQDGRMKCLGAAVSPVPEGPFAPLAEPLRCTPGYWNIDPYAVLDGDRWFLMWREDDAANATGKIVAAPLRPDGLAIGGAATTLVVGEFAWEEGHPGDDTPGIGPIENPAMARHPATGEWLLTWSANRWETDAYATGLAVCDGPLGPCRRISRDTPWLRRSSDPSFTTAAQLSGAGGLSFVVGADGQLCAVLHAYPGLAQAAGAPRLAWAYRVEAEPVPGPGYRLVDIRRNHSTEATVKGT